VRWRRRRRRRRREGSERQSEFVSL